MTVRFGTAARADLREAARYYEQERSGLGMEFLRAVDEILQQIDEWPLAGRTVWPDFRARIVRRFPYWVIYRRHESATWITALAHQSRDPDYWRSRWEVREPVADYLRLAA